MHDVAIVDLISDMKLPTSLPETRYRGGSEYDMHMPIVASTNRALRVSDSFAVLLISYMELDVYVNGEA